MDVKYTNRPLDIAIDFDGTITKENSYPEIVVIIIATKQIEIRVMAKLFWAAALSSIFINMPILHLVLLIVSIL